MVPSAFTTVPFRHWLASVADFDFDKIFEGVDWFHITGITPALGENVVEICLARPARLLRLTASRSAAT